MKIFSYIISMVIFAVIVVGLFLVDSPSVERMQRFDQMRISSLSEIKNQITNYYITHKSLPETVEMAILYDIPRRDPETMEEYRYSVTGDKTFELCATFSLEYLEEGKYMPELERPVVVTDSGTKSSVVTSWDHPKGYHCFEAEIVDNDK